MPITPPTSSVASTASGSGKAPLTQSTPISAEATPLIEPTERSISPSISTQTMPSAITPVVEQSKSRFTRLFDDRKIGLMAVKIVQMMTSPTITGSEPRSPDRTRSMKALTCPPIPLGVRDADVAAVERRSSGSCSALLIRVHAIGRPAAPAARRRCRRRR